ncbi:MAG: hypothetical protein VKP62_16065 [Candidatus Sericytochromatia bacterium]|nr:hypothetical protein [Candidatus Sericytochromatia bacterium]
MKRLLAVCLFGTTLACPATSAFASPASPSRSGPPLVLQTPPQAPTGSLWVDASLVGLTAMLGWRLVGLLSPWLGQGAQASDGLAAGAAVALVWGLPTVGLVTYRDSPLALDLLAVSGAGALLGIGGGLLLTRGLSLTGLSDPTAQAVAMGVGQGLGTAVAFHTYREARPGLTGLDRLPAKRRDDPIDDWKFWRERRNP